MALNSELLTIIVCPNCHGEVDYDEPGQVIECRECHYRYPVRDDIPVLLIDDAEKPAGMPQTPNPAVGGPADPKAAASTDTDTDPSTDPSIDPSIDSGADPGSETKPAGA